MVECELFEFCKNNLSSLLRSEPSPFKAGLEEAMVRIPIAQINAIEINNLFDVCFFASKKLRMLLLKLCDHFHVDNYQ